MVKSRQVVARVSEAQTRMANVSAATNLREVARVQNGFVRLEK